MNPLILLLLLGGVVAVAAANSRKVVEGDPIIESESDDEILEASARGLRPPIVEGGTYYIVYRMPWRMTPKTAEEMLSLVGHYGTILGEPAIDDTLESLHPGVDIAYPMWDKSTRHVIVTVLADKSIEAPQVISDLEGNWLKPLYWVQVA